MIIICALLCFSLQAAQLDLLPHIHESGKPILPALTEKYAHSIFTNDHACAARRQALYQLMKDNPEAHMTLYAHFQQDEPRTQAMQPIERFFKKSKTQDKSELQLMLYPTFYFQKCMHPSCPFTPFEVHNRFVDESVRSFNDLLRTPGRKSLHVIDFASGRLLATSRMMLKIFESLNRGLRSAEEKITVQLHCIDPIYSDPESSDAFKILMSRVQESFNLLMKEGERFKPTIDFKPTQWHPNTGQALRLLQTINLFKRSKPTDSSYGVLITGIDFQNFLAYKSDAANDFRDLLNAAPANDTRVVAGVENEVHFLPPHIVTTIEDAKRKLDEFHSIETTEHSKM